jgi:Tetrapyrrole (Corrin/Porphyrin) Methylases
VTKAIARAHGSLTIVGVGPDRESIGRSAFEFLTERARAARKDDRIWFYSLDVDPLRCEDVLGPTRVRNFRPFYKTSAPRGVFYAREAQILINRAFRLGKEVIVLASGNPLVMAEPVKQIRMIASARKHAVTIVPGMSFLDTVLAPVGGFNDLRGLAIQFAYAVWNGEAKVTNTIPTLLVQLGAWSRSGKAAVTRTDSPERREFLEKLVSRLRKQYPADHRVDVLDAVQDPERLGAIVARTVALCDLPDVAMSAWANLYLPAVEERRTYGQPDWPPAEELANESFCIRVRNVRGARTKTKGSVRRI